MTVTRKTPTTSKKPAQRPAASYVLSAPKGPRTISHKQIKQAVEKVFRDRLAGNV
jgi:hypothetical protein